MQTETNSITKGLQEAAREAFSGGDYAGARAKLLEIQQQEGDSPGICKALAEYDRMVALAPHEANAYTIRGEAYQKFQRFDSALADFTKAIELEPESP